MKEENGGKRKLSKRKDAEAAVAYYLEKGYPAGSVREYLLTIANSNYEEWRRANPDALDIDFMFNLKKMSTSGALVDLAKFNDVSKNLISRMTADTVVDAIIQWAEEFNPEYHEKLTRDKEFTKGIFSIDRGGNKPRKDIACWQDAPDYTAYFFERPTSFDLPETMAKEDGAAILERYLADYNHDADKDGWFAGMKAICPDLGYSPDVKAYKKDPDSFKGHVGDVSTAIRVAITGRRNTPDLYAIMQLLGEEECKQRLTDACSFFRQ
jgi:glutamyl-tRNA synthetase